MFESPKIEISDGLVLDQFYPHYSVFRVPANGCENRKPPPRKRWGFLSFCCEVFWAAYAATLDWLMRVGVDLFV